jgi:hypothetical protein
VRRVSTFQPELLGKVPIPEVLYGTKRIGAYDIRLGQLRPDGVEERHVPGVVYVQELLGLRIQLQSGRRIGLHARLVYEFVKLRVIILAIVIDGIGAIDVAQIVVRVVVIGAPARTVYLAAIFFLLRPIYRVVYLL